jgi:hypothetical protein
MMATPALAEDVGPHNLPQVPSAASPAAPSTASHAPRQDTLEQRLGAQIGALVIQNAALQVKIGEMQTRLDAMVHAQRPKSQNPKKPE